MIPEDKIQEVLRAADLVEIVSEVVALKQAGSQYTGLCPFHEEKTPSFSVSPAKQFFYCFGCQKGGNVFRFVMEHERATFPEVVRMLARRYGIAVEPEPGYRRESQRDRDDLYQVLKWAADVYHKHLLVSPDAARVREYVAGRGITPESTAAFRLGFAPEQWDFLLQRARKQGVPDALLLEAGLVSSNKEKGSQYDRFRGRVMFPILDVRDRVVGFGGRILPGSTSKEQAKYINTSETVLFSKGRLLYGLNFARDAAVKEGSLAIMEGYTDVILAHQFGFTAAVATLGTALTRDHVRLIRRFAERVVAVYDGDSAGEKASERSLDIFLEEDLEFRVATLPAGLDPCDCLNQRGPEVFRGVLSAAVDLFAYRLTLVRKRWDCTSVEGKAKAIDHVLESLALTPNEVKRRLQVELLARELDVTSALLEKRLATLREQASRHALRPVAAAGAQVPAGPAPARTGPDSPAWLPAASEPGRRETARELLDIVLSAPALIPRVREALPPADWPTEGSRKVAEALFAHWDQHGELNIAGFLGSLGDPALADRLAGVIAEGEGKGHHEARLEGVLKTITLWRREAEARAVRREVRNDEESLRRLEETLRKRDQERQARTKK